ncbi:MULTISPECIES: hypothetical protein [unclassified Nocardioides]|uniref:hypothetical protein n=1 Tax=unclassified Nocardioides TaxID=2615069 RepID=UPI000056F802|nr:MULTISPECIES: hypothetical protein [unclassified Nocardioides]ABL82025.1 hypothetical protein Noca_2521 [Nocardioides sp. JS614]
MSLGLSLLCLFCVGLVITATARPAGPQDRRRELDRRRRLLQRHPDYVNLHDVERLLLDSGLPVRTAERVLRRARARQVCARTMWRWASVHGTELLVVAMDAGLAEDAMLDHLDAGTCPRWDSLRIFASLSTDDLPAGMPRAELVDLDSIPTLDELTFPIGLTDWATERTTDRQTGRVPDDLSGFGDWPHVAF